MKKGFIVLLMVLVAASAFAGFSGYVTFGGQYDIEDTTWGMYSLPDLEFYFNHKFAEGSAKGEGDFYAEISAQMEIRDSGASGILAGKTETGASADPGTTSYAVITSSAAYQIRARINKAAIYYKDWTFNLLTAGGGYNYAKGSFLTDSYGYGYTPNVLTIASAGNWNGVSATYNGYTFGLWAKGNVEAESATVFAQAQTKSFKFAEEAASVQAAGVFKLVKTSSDKTYTAGASAKASYKNDSFSANAAADFQVVKSSSKTTYALEAYAKAVILSDYTAEVYFANAAAETFEKASLNAKVAASFEMEEITIDVAATAYDILNRGYQLKTSTGSYKVGKTERWAEVSADVAYDALSVDAYFGLALHKGDNFASSTGFGASASYKFEKFTAVAGADFVSSKAADALTEASVYGYIKSTTIINGATIKAGYKSANFAKSGSEVADKGCVYAQVNVAF